MKNRNVLKVGSLEVTVTREIYNAANCEFERVKKKNQRLRRDGLLYKEKSLDELFSETEYEPSSNDDVEQTAINNILEDYLWRTIALSLPEKNAFIITAYYRDMLTDQQISERLVVSRQAITKQRTKIEARLKDILREFKNIF